MRGFVNKEDKPFRKHFTDKF